jgi:hypothetical protein
MTGGSPRDKRAIVKLIAFVMQFEGAPMVSSAPLFACAPIKGDNWRAWAVIKRLE